MIEYKVIQYNSSYFEVWNEFVKHSKNGTFLFHRTFMEYHSDRFVDFSLLVYKGITLVGVFPANIKGAEVHSHQGLTYGGLILRKNIGVAKVEAVFTSILTFFKKERIEQLFVKSIPIFYHKTPCFELEPMFNTLQATLYSREQNFAIDYSIPIEIHKTKRKHYNKNGDIGFEIVSTSNFSNFWENVLEPRLLEKHNTKPVHSLSEMEYLHSHFPENIVQHEIWLNNEVLAGITIFKTDTTVKSQYGATTLKGEQYRALDFLFIHLIEKFKEEGYRFFDMGIVAGNYSLLKQKEELGCNQYLQDFYKILI